MAKFEQIEFNNKCGCGEQENVIPKIIEQVNHNSLLINEIITNCCGGEYVSKKEFDEFKNQTNSNFTNLNSEINKLTTLTTSLDSKIDSINNELNTKINNVNSDLNIRIDTTNSKIDTINKDLTNRMNIISQDIAQLKYLSDIVDFNKNWKQVNVGQPITKGKYYLVGRYNKNNDYNNIFGNSRLYNFWTIIQATDKPSQKDKDMLFYCYIPSYSLYDSLKEQIYLGVDFLNLLIIGRKDLPYGIQTPLYQIIDSFAFEYIGTDKIPQFFGMKGTQLWQNLNHQ